MHRTTEKEGQIESSNREILRKIDQDERKRRLDREWKHIGETKKERH